jgi:hypothetical protein
MSISLNTARNHTQRVIEKLGVHSRLEAVVAAVHANLVEVAGTNLDVASDAGSRKSPTTTHSASGRSPLD